MAEIKKQALIGLQRRERTMDPLSPTVKAAAQLEALLPIKSNSLRLNKTLSCDSCPFFHLETDDFLIFQRTIKLACEEKFGKYPLFKTIEEFKAEILKLTAEKTIWRVTPDKISFALHDWLKEGHPIFIYLSYLDPHENDMRANYTDYDQLMQLFLRACGEERRNQIASDYTQVWFDRLDMPFYNQVFFASYGQMRRLPSTLENARRVISYPALERQDFRKLLWEYHVRGQCYAAEVLHEDTVSDLALNDVVLNWYENNMSGFSEETVRRLLASAGEYDKPERSVGPLVSESKKKMLKQHDRLELVEVEQNDEIKGLEAVEKWLMEHSEAIRRKGNPPTGILLVGIPGTGKSATAQKAARALKLPLVKLDMSRILGGHVGDSEKGMSEMLEDLRSAAPCVLWIDEIEKALSGADGNSGDGGVIQRLFGMLLTFIQENKRPVFTVTTANDVSKLPPEFFRNGRFDQTFCLMMPSYHGCCDIMAAKVRKYLGVTEEFAEKHKAKFFDCCVGTKEKPRFLTGADIDAVVKEIIWHGQELYLTGDDERDAGAIVNLLEEYSKKVRVTAEPTIKQSMEKAARSYLTMIQGGFKMACDEKTDFVAKNLDVEAIQCFAFDPKEYDEDETLPELPLCMKVPMNVQDRLSNVENAYKSTEENDKSYRLPEYWYDAVLYYELAKAMSHVVLFDRELVMDDVRRDYWCLRREQRKRERD